MCSAHFQDLLTKLRGQSMQFVQSADIPNPAPTRTPLGGLDVLSPDTRVTGQWLTKFPRSPHEICRVSNPCSLPVQFTVTTIVQNHIGSQNQGLGNFSLPKHCGMPIFHKPNQIRILFHKIVNDLKSFGHQSVC